LAERDKERKTMENNARRAIRRRKRRRVEGRE
jgi:hypothetical protein